MPKSIKVAHLLLLLLMLISLKASSGLFAAHNSKASAHTRAVQGYVPQDLSGSYDGTVYFRDKQDKKFVMVGTARLEIKGQEFTLTKLQGKKLKGKPLTGKITTAIITEKENLGVGEIEPKNESSIEIRWHRDKDRNILKIVRAKGANRLFRFCTATLTQAQCVGKISNEVGLKPGG